MFFIHCPKECFAECLHWATKALREVVKANSKSSSKAVWSNGSVTKILAALGFPVSAREVWLGDSLGQ